jgi:hypothetical protein
VTATYSEATRSPSANIKHSQIRRICFVATSSVHHVEDGLVFDLVICVQLVLGLDVLQTQVFVSDACFSTQWHRHDDASVMDMDVMPVTHSTTS